MRLAVAVSMLMSLVAVPAFAGTVGMAEGKVNWQSTQCTAPTPPKSVIDADRHTGANDMNVLITQYNEYVVATQTYMSCLSSESENDANAVSAQVTEAGKQKIDEVQKALTSLGKPFLGKSE